MLESVRRSVGRPVAITGSPAASLARGPGDSTGIPDGVAIGDRPRNSEVQPAIADTAHSSFARVYTSTALTML